MELELECIAIEKDEGISAILGHAGFIKTVEDLYEAMVGSVPGIKFGIAFAEASGPRLVRSDGNDDGLRRQAEHRQPCCWETSIPDAAVRAAKAAPQRRPPLSCRCPSPARLSRRQRRARPFP